MPRAGRQIRDADERRHMRHSACSFVLDEILICVGYAIIGDGERLHLWRQLSEYSKAARPSIDSAERIVEEGARLMDVRLPPMPFGAVTDHTSPRFTSIWQDCGPV